MASKTKGKARNKGTGSVVKKKNRFYFRLRERGKEIYTLLRDLQGKPVTTRPKAEEAASLIAPVLQSKSQEDVAEYILNVRQLNTPLLVPLAEAWETFLAQTSRPDSGEKTLTLYQGFFRKFIEWLHESKAEITHLSQVDADIMRSFFSSLTTRNVSGRTYNGYRQALHLIFKHLLPVLEIERNPVDPIANRSKDTVNRKDFTEKQVAAIFKGFETGFFYETEVEKLTAGRNRIREKKTLEFKPMHPEQLKVLLYLCCYTGCRGQDGCLMRWSNIDLQRNLITYIPIKTARKTGKSVMIPLHPDLRQALETAKAWRDTNFQGEEYILPDIAKRYQYNPSGIQKDVMKVIRCATGLKTSTDKTPGKRILKANLYSLHSFRHTFVSFCANAGVSLDVVAEVVGHGSPIMTRHYAHISSQAKQAIINALPAQPQSSEKPSESRGTGKEESERKKLLKVLDGLSTEEIKSLLEHRGKK
jgi:integrase